MPTPPFLSPSTFFLCADAARAETRSLRHTFLSASVAPPGLIA
uniref:Uncharacterized protein n=1 Tax=Arundo donax TaxID=35708 RepID=A0A0A9F9K2_ARUDO